VEKRAAAEWPGVSDWTRVEHEGQSFIGDGAAMGFIARIDGGGALKWGVFFWKSSPIRELAFGDGRTLRH
jgi:hypothetical protein